MASVPLTTLCREGVIVDLSDEMDDWSVIKPKQVTDRMEVKKGDIVVFHRLAPILQLASGRGRGALFPASPGR